MLSIFDNNIVRRVYSFNCIFFTFYGLVSPSLYFIELARVENSSLGWSSNWCWSLFLALGFGFKTPKLHAQLWDKKFVKFRSLLIWSLGPLLSNRDLSLRLPSGARYSEPWTQLTLQYAQKDKPDISVLYL